MENKKIIFEKDTETLEDVNGVVIKVGHYSLLAHQGQVRVRDHVEDGFGSWYCQWLEWRFRVVAGSKSWLFRFVFQQKDKGCPAVVGLWADQG